MSLKAAKLSGPGDQELSLREHPYNPQVVGLGNHVRTGPGGPCVVLSTLKCRKRMLEGRLGGSVG